MITEELKQLYQTHTGSPATDITELSSSGSNRRYFRLSGSASLIGVSGTSIEENNAFIYMAAHFREKGLPVPQVYCWSVDKSFYLQEDLGDTLLFQALEKGRKSCFFESLCCTRRSHFCRLCSLKVRRGSTSANAILYPNSIGVRSFGT